MPTADPSRPGPAAAHRLEAPDAVGGRARRPYRTPIGRVADTLPVPVYVRAIEWAQRGQQVRVPATVDRSVAQGRMCPGQCHGT